MSRQFVLIDHSIEDAAGHHLEYARRVLGAARAKGFRTVLAVNQRARQLECPEADVIFKPFSRTVWEIHAQPALRTVAGFVLRRDVMAADPQHVSRFSAELASLIAEAGVTEADIVFVPTLGGPEALAISTYSASAAAVAVHWHLLFRRDVEPRASLTNLRGTIARWRIQSALLLAARRFGAGVRYLYTDTEELTQRYDSLGAGAFQTLPIPLDERLGLKRARSGSGPLVVSYVGDMRDEKGIHLLPAIIASIRQSGYDKAKVLFRIQGNLPAAGVTRQTLRAKEALLSARQDGVEVLEGPLASDAYIELMLNSDVVLIPYSRTHYAARSSGVFAEAVAAGIPTVHPRESWMGRNAMDKLGAGYSKPSEIRGILEKIIMNYSKYETSSLTYTSEWRTRHSAQNLAQMLIERQYKYT